MANPDCAARSECRTMSDLPQRTSLNVAFLAADHAR